MQSTTRRVAVIGGNRIPFARSNTVYSHASNQDMLTAAIDGLVTRFGLEGERLGEVVAGAVLKHSRDFNLTRESVLGSEARARDPGLRHPAGLRHRHPGRDPGGQQDRPRPDRGRHRRRHRHHLRRADRGQREAPQDPARGQPRQVDAGPARRAAKVRPGTSRRRSRRTASRAPAVDGRARRAHRAGVEDRPRGAGRARRRLPPATSPRRTTRGFLDDLVTPFRGLERDQNLRPTPRSRSSPPSSRSSARARPPR